MKAATGGVFLGERLISGAASGALSLGMVLALVGLSNAGTVRHAVRPTLSTFDLGAGASGEAGEEAVSPRPRAPRPSRQPALAPPALPPVRPVPDGAPAEPPPQTAPEPLQSAALALDVPAAPEGVRMTLAVPLPATEPATTSTAAEVQGALPARTSSPEGGYKADVWRHLQRFRRPNAVGAGSALVRFAVGAGGRVFDLAIARSSGSRRFDGEALTLVRRAQPFPLPPSQIATAFVFEIKGS